MIRMVKEPSSRQVMGQRRGNLPCTQLILVQTLAAYGLPEHQSGVTPVHSSTVRHPGLSWALLLFQHHQ